MNFPPIFYSLAFWKMLSYIGAGVLALLVSLGKLPPEDALEPATLLAAILAFLQFLGVEPEVRAKIAEENAAKARLETKKSKKS